MPGGPTLRGGAQVLIAAKAFAPARTSSRVSQPGGLDLVLQIDDTLAVADGLASDVAVVAPGDALTASDALTGAAAYQAQADDALAVQDALTQDTGKGVAIADAVPVWDGESFQGFRAVGALNIAYLMSAASPGADDTALTDRLTAAGHTVTQIQLNTGNPVPTGYDLIIAARLANVSGWVDATTTPVLSLGPKPHAQWNTGVTATTANLINFTPLASNPISDPAAVGASTQVVTTAAQAISLLDTGFGSSNVMQDARAGTGRIVLEHADVGAVLADSTSILGSRRVRFGMPPPVSNWTAAAFTWFDNAIAWVTASAGGVSTSFGKNVDDTASLADAVALSEGLAPADTLTVADSLASAPAVGIADTAAVADTPTPQFSLGGVTINDTLTVADLLARSSTTLIPDALAVADALSRLMSPAVSDALTVTDAQVRAVTTSVPDSLTVGDQVAPGLGALGLTLSVDDTLAVLDGLTSAQGFSTSVADALTVADARSFVVARNLADALTVADNARLGLGVVRADTLLVVDLLTFARGQSVALADALAVLDAVVTRLGGLSPAVITLSAGPATFLVITASAADRADLSAGPATITA